MVTRPVFKPHFSVHRVEPDTVVLLSEVHELALRGEFYYHLAPWLDGRTVDEIAGALHGQATPDEVRQAVDVLVQNGYAQELSEQPPEEAAFWSSLGLQPDKSAVRRGKVEVGLRDLGGIGLEAFRAALEPLGFPVGEGPGRLGLVLADDYLNPQLAEYNREALEARRPWLLVRPRGRRPWLGPLFIPGHTACWECLAHRQRFNRQVELSVKGEDGFTPTARGAAPTSLSLVAHHAALSLARCVGLGTDPQLESRLQTLDLLTGEVESHAVIRRPQCPACGPGPQELDLESVRLALQPTPLGSNCRSVSVQEIIRRYQVHVSPLTGVVRELVDASPDSDGVMHVWDSGISLARPRSLRQSALGKEFRTATSGKGRSSIEAQAGAICEAIERYSSTALGYELTRRGSLRSLGSQAMHPNHSMLFSDTQYENREVWNREHSLLHHVPHPFPEDVEMDWTALWSLSRQEVRFLPTAYCFYLYGKPEVRYCPADSNGNAAGWSLEEAILQGFFELAERDAVALWWYNQVRRPGVDFAAVDDPYLHQVIGHYRKLGRTLWALDVTADLGVPTFVAASSVEATGKNIALGFGAHSEWRIALTRAVTEMNQFLSMADVPTQPDATVNSWLQTPLERCPYLIPDPDARAQPKVEPAWSDAQEAVRWCQKLVEGRGLELLVLDQTRADVGLPVAKVVVPGLRHFWPRFGPGRLYDVPVELGWRTQALTEAELNPSPMFW